MSMGKGPATVVGVSNGVFTTSGRYLRGPTAVVAGAAVASSSNSPVAAAADATTKMYMGRRVVLTREEGKNGDLLKRLESRGVECVEMPLIESVDGEDRAALPTALTDPAGWTWVCITSPEAANVFLQAWRAAGKPDLPIATVGAGTAKIIAPEYATGALTAPTFTPSKATAETLVAELPLLPAVAAEGKISSPPRVLYPASAKAERTLQDGLAARGAAVVRLNTYSTEPVTSLDAAVLTAAKAADVITFGSPSAVKAWVALSGLDGTTAAAQHPLYACIGGTSAKACNKIGLPGVMFPENPGLDGWEGAVLEALDTR